MTFSVAARCAKTGMFGLAVSSSSPAVAARCAFVRAGVGAVASQNITDPALGNQCLDLMQNGATALEAVDSISTGTQHIEYRQLTAVDSDGNSASYIGSQSLGVFAVSNDTNIVCAGNLLANDSVPKKMVDAFHTSEGHLAQRLLDVMRAALEAGGEAGPVHSAGLLIADKTSWPICDLRVDWDESGKPVHALQTLWQLYEPQLEDYVTRARNPASAPSYGVPGDA